MLAAIGAALVALATATVADLTAEATERRAAQRTFLALSRDGQRLHQTVLEALARGEADDRVFAAVTRTGHSVDERLERAAATRDGTHVEVQRAMSALASYRAVAERLLPALARGDRSAGGADRALEPAFGRVAERLATVEAARMEQAATAEKRARRLSTATVGLLVVLLLLLMTVHQRGRRRAEVTATEAAALGASEARLRGIVDDSSDLVLLIGPDAVIRSASRAASDLLGVDPSELEGHVLTDLLHADDLPLLTSAASGERHARLEIRMRHRNGYWVTTEAVLNDMTGDAHVGALVLTVRDVTDRKAFEEQLRHRAFHDPLTQLANRALLLDRLQHALSREGRYEDQVAVLFVDLDDFKVVNDSLGHHSGDELLVHVARRLRACVRSADTAARLGGDEFAVLLEGVDDLDETVALARRILDALAEPFALGGLTIQLGASVGVAVGTAQAVSADELLRNADIAMYAAKHEGKGDYVVFRADRHDDLVRRFGAPSEDDADRASWFERDEDQRNEVRRLLDADDALVMAFQPIIELATGEVAGYEALARFPHDPGQRPPNVWFAQAHRCGLGVELEARAALSALALRDQVPAGYLAVNVSPTALRADDLRERLPADLDGVLVEITEHDLVADGERLQTTIGALRARGARIAVDDAGAGYAGLRQLMLLRPDAIKLDRSLVEDVASDQAKQALVECFVRFADRTGAAVCAEGIESIADLCVLADLGVGYGQGYAIARPAFGWPSPCPEAVAALRTRAVALPDGSALVA